MASIIVQKMEQDRNFLVCSLNNSFTWNLLSSRSERINIRDKIHVWMEFNLSLYSIILRLLIVDRQFIINFPGEIKIEYCVSIGTLEYHQLKGCFTINETTTLNGGLVIGKVQNPSLMRQISTKITIKLTKKADLSRLIAFEINFVKPTNNFSHVNFKESQFSDFTIIFDNHEYKVHKIVLAVASGFFKSLFEMIEYDEDYKNINKYFCTNTVGCNFKHFEFLLNFIYSGNFETYGFGPYFFVQLYRLAVFYEIEDITKHCLYNIEKSCREIMKSHDIIVKTFKYATECGLKELVDDCWFLIKFGILRIFQTLKDEPLPYEVIIEFMHNKMTENEFIKKYSAE